MGQCTNDVYPTALKLAAWFGIRRLTAAMAVLRGAFAAQGGRVRRRAEDGPHPAAGRGADDPRPGVRHLRADARRGRGPAGRGRRPDLRDQHGRHRDRHRHHRASRIRGPRLRATCATITGIPLVTAQDLVEATQDCGAFVQLSGVLKRVAVKLSKTCNDLRLLSSGPRAGFNEINLPARAGGLLDHAGQGQPGDPRGGEPGRLRGDRQRRDDHHGRRGRPAPAQRLRAGDLLQPGRSISHLRRRLPDARGELRARHHRQPRAPAGERRELDRHRHRAQPLHRLRATPPRSRWRRTRPGAASTSSCSRRG